MAVDSVNNSNSRKYAIGAATIGGGIVGASTAYLSKPFFKNALPTDEFVRTVIVNSINADLKKSVMLDDSIELAQNAFKSDNPKQISESVKSFINSYSKKLDEQEMKILTGIANETNIDNQKSKFNELFGTQIEDKLKLIRNKISNCWDKNTKKFVGEGAIFDHIRDAAASIRLKYALKYGAIGAAALGLGALLLTGNKPQEKPQSVNRQA